MKKELTFEELKEFPTGTILKDWTDGELRCLIVRGPASLCAYVGVLIGHPLAGQDYNSLNVRCHNGLKFGGEGIGTFPKGYWWYGCDYANAGDKSFYDISRFNNYGWTVKDVENDMKEMIEDFKKLAKPFKKPKKENGFTAVWTKKKTSEEFYESFIKRAEAMSEELRAIKHDIDLLTMLDEEIKLLKTKEKFNQLIKPKGKTFMNTAIKIFAITGIVFGVLAMIGNADDPEGFGYTLIVMAVWMPLCVLSLVKISQR